MERIKKIPVIGYIFRLFCTFLKLPKHLDALYQGIETEVYERKASREEQKEKETALKVRIDELSNQIYFQEKHLDEMKKEIAKLLEEGANCASSIQELKWKNKERADEIEELQRISGKLSHLYVDDEYIQRLNLLCSTHPTIWGDSEKISVSELAALPGCFFNTNSGRITVGDYTFSGSNVSLLAGSHDVNLTGLLRRDVELSDGCDITIGNGVWLASNCTILGPATIGDNAVIAAGAVVTPGTIVPDGTIYAGIPAKQIGTIELDESEDANSEAIQNAIKRNNGTLFVSGWTEKTDYIVDNKIYNGHYLLRENALIYVAGDTLELYYHHDSSSNCTINVTVDDEEQNSYHLNAIEGLLQIQIHNLQRMIHRIIISADNVNTKLFIAKMPQPI